MNVTDAIKIILRNEHKSQTDLCKDLGVAKTTLNTQLRKGNITTDSLIKIMNELGYEILLRPKNGIDKVERTVVVDKTEKVK